MSENMARIWLVRLGLIVALLGFWEAVSLAVGGVAAALPGPYDEARALGPVLGQQSTWTAVAQTLRAWALGFALATIAGLAVGAVLGTSRQIDHATRPTFDFVRTIPPIAVLPLGALLLGVGTGFEAWFIVVGAVWPVLIQTMYGVRNAEPVLLDVAALLRMRRRTKMRLILAPSAIPFIATGVRLSAVMAFLLAISVELLAGVPGVGAVIYSEQFAGAYPQMYLFVLIATLLGAAIGVLFAAGERRVRAWVNAAPAAT